MNHTQELRPAVRAKELQPLHKDVLVHDMYFGEQITPQGIIILDDNKKDRGIHPRWAKVYAVGPENKDEIAPGQWILIAHGRWSRGIDLHDMGVNLTVRRVDPKDILLVTDKDPEAKNACFVGDSIL